MNKENKNSRITDPTFFMVSAEQLAPKLLGKILVRKINNQLIKVKIVETEAYDGNVDQACHAHLKNKSRWKAAALSNRGGCAYVYLIYGMYYCFNIVSSVARDPQGVLVRAVEPLECYAIPSSFQYNLKKKLHYFNGPGKLCRTLNIDLSLNHVDLTTSDLIYLENQPELEKGQIAITKRVNIDYAGEDKGRL
jgi:DNA-3-methyladenine glycosylase